MAKKNTITKERIEDLIHSSRFDYSTVFGKCTVVSMQLPNGFILTESSACVDPANYDEKLGYEICLRKLSDRLWELEGYLLQTEIARKEAIKRAPVCFLEQMTVKELNDAGFKGTIGNGTLNLELTGLKSEEGRL